MARERVAVPPGQSLGPRIPWTPRVKPSTFDRRGRRRRRIRSRREPRPGIVRRAGSTDTVLTASRSVTRVGSVARGIRGTRRPTVRRTRRTNFWQGFARGQGARRPSTPISSPAGIAASTAGTRRGNPRSVHRRTTRPPEEEQEDTVRGRTRTGPRTRRDRVPLLIPRGGTTSRPLHLCPAEPTPTTACADISNLRAGGVRPTAGDKDLSKDLWNRNLR